jgi:CAAX prenyl protease-like protein
MPFLAILASGMITRAVSDRFEWLYPLRFFAAALVLWHYRRRYRNLDWRFGWAAALIGGIAFLMWLSLDWFTAAGSAGTTGTRLAALPTPARVTWIFFRALAASTTVPIAEELAFRGFLLRRLVSADFEKVGASSITLFSFVVSSIAFGLLHGNRWVAGTCAGLLYAWAFRGRSRIGDAIAAHAITNALLAAWVILSGSWQMW